MRINTNISAMNTYGRLTNANAAKSESLSKLSSGLRINKAGDDAAGLAISEKMKGQVGGLKQAVRNAQDGVSLIQTAEGALNETHAILGRMRDLANQGANGTLSQDDRGEINKEFEALKTEITRISDTTEFNTKKLLNTKDQNFTFQIGANGGQTMSVTIGKMDSENLGLSKTSLFGDEDILVGNARVDDARQKVTDAKLAVINFDQATLDTAATDAGTAHDTAKLAASARNVDVSALVNGDAYADKAAVAAVIGADEADALAAAGIDFTSSQNGSAIKSAFAALDFEALDANERAAQKDLVSATKAKEAGIKPFEDAVKTAEADLETVKALELDEVGRKNASDAIADIDAAIKSVSAQRSDLGAAQNRLSHTVKNLTTTQENLSEANSRIRDVDMAEEMMSFTKNNILSQAATSMLSQANAMPNSVLGLLQG